MNEILEELLRISLRLRSFGLLLSRCSQEEVEGEIVQFSGEFLRDEVHRLEQLHQTLEKLWQSQ